MQEVLVEFSLCFSFDDGHFKNGESVYSQLEQEVNFKFRSFLLRPIWVIPVNFRALSAATNNGGEPIFFSEENVCNDGGEGVEA